MKRMLSLLLALLTVIGLFAGCFISGELFRGRNGDILFGIGIQAVGIILALFGLGISGDQSLHEVIKASGFFLSH